MDSQHLLVPIKVQALVIDDIVIQKSGVIELDRRYVANDGRWSPQVYNYRFLTGSLTTPGPRPFYGAERKFGTKDADQLVLDPGTRGEALPKDEDRGVYLHWVLPAGLRHANKDKDTLDFPPLPEHWLIVRFSRNDSTQKTRAWFVDGGAIVSEDLPANLLLPDTGRVVAKRIGKVVPLEQFATADFRGDRTTINAIGNSFTSSPTFTAFIAENRNVFSWHDKLEDLRKADGRVREETTLTYCVLGWYHDPKSEPLANADAKVTERTDAANKLLGWLINPPGWSIDANSGATANLLNRRSVFHGLVAHINYWSAGTYKGQILGYPGAPAVAGTLSKTNPAFKVGVGNSAEDALVSLVSSEYSDEQQKGSLAKKQPNLWKALEAVIYRQSETLVRSWNVAPRDMIVHQNSFATHEAGKIWYLRPPSNQRGMFPAAADRAAAEAAIKPTLEQLAKLKDLNKLQAQADAVSRDLAAAQQDLYMRWWKIVNKSNDPFDDDVDEEAADCRTLAQQVKTLRDKLSGLNLELKDLPKQLEALLTNGLELKFDGAPRFWLPADPVIVVKNCGSPSKHQFPREHPCRVPEQIVTTAKVVVSDVANTINTPTGVADIAAAAQRYLPVCPPVLKGLLDEASLMEQAVRNLADRSLGTKKTFVDTTEWTAWTNRLVHDLTWDGDMDDYPRDQITLGPEAANIRPHRLVDLWVKQPWSPLFIDWQITWFPSKEPATPEHPFGAAWNFDEADFVPDKNSMPETGYTVRGRSLLSPIDDRIFEEPIDTLRKLLKARSGAGQTDSSYPPAVLEILKRYEVVWSETLRELPQGGLMGQALTGFHQALLGRDISSPRLTPDAARPWVRNDDLRSFEGEVKGLLQIPERGMSGERVTPAAPAATTIPFSLIRAGALRIDELWLIDDFGQFADLLGLTAARSASSGQVFHPRIRWHDDKKKFAMPPRVLQPVRLNFRFTAASETESALNSICGWIFYNPLDRALVLCDRKGELMGHLVIAKDENETHIKWEAGASGVALANVSDPTLKAFAQSLIQTTRTEKPRLLQLLNLIDNALERIRPSATHRDTILVGRPLALVSASVGLELFGKAWANPQKKPVAPSEGSSGDASIDGLRVRVDLGYAHSIEDGLIGYFKEGAYQRLVVPQLSPNVQASDYVGAQDTHGLRVGFGAPQPVTLLMDPWGSVQAACGLVPAKTITLADPELNKTAAHMEASFRVGPILVQADRLAVPTPTGNKGTWNFSGPLTDQKAAALVALDPRYFSDQPIVATEGRLLLLNDE